jgi:hypothetical protein
MLAMAPYVRLIADYVKFSTALQLNNVSTIRLQRPYGFAWSRGDAAETGRCGGQTMAA